MLRVPADASGCSRTPAEARAGRSEVRGRRETSPPLQRAAKRPDPDEPGSTTLRHCGPPTCASPPAGRDARRMLAVRDGGWQRLAADQRRLWKAARRNSAPTSPVRRGKCARKRRFARPGARRRRSAAAAGRSPRASGPDGTPRPPADEDGTVRHRPAGSRSERGWSRSPRVPWSQPSASTLRGRPATGVSCETRASRAWAGGRCRGVALRQRRQERGGSQATGLPDEVHEARGDRGPSRTRAHGRVYPGPEHAKAPGAPACHEKAPPRPEQPPARDTPVPAGTGSRGSAEVTFVPPSGLVAPLDSHRGRTPRSVLQDGSGGAADGAFRARRPSGPLIRRERTETEGLMSSAVPRGGLLRREGSSRAVRPRLEQRAGRAGHRHTPFPRGGMVAGA